MTKRKIILHGALREQFGEVFEFEVETAGEAVRALNAAFPDHFIGAIKDGSYYLIRGDEKTGMAVGEEHLNSFRLGTADLHIIPAVTGSARSGKQGGVVKAVLGVALIGVAIFMSGGLAGGGLAALSGTAIPLGGMSITYGHIALFGLALAVSGASSMLSQKEKPKAETKREDSFSFSGPSNVYEQGNPVPLIYGRVMTGGAPISSGVDIEDIGAWRDPAGSGVPGYGQAMINGALTSVG